MLEELRAAIPGGVLAMVRIPGLGPKKAAALHKELGITSLDALRDACEADKVQALKGFGKKTQDKILAGIDLAARAHERMYWAHADEIVQELLAHMRQVKGIRQMEVAGSYRRGRETIGDVDLLVDADDADAVMDQLGRFEELATVLGRGDTKMSIRLGRGLQIDLRVVPSKSFGAALQYFTGSKDHNVILRGMAKDRGLRINEYGVFRTPEKLKKGGKSKPTSDEVDDARLSRTSNSPHYVAGRTEEEVYATLDLPWFPPEIREARQEFAWAAAGELPKLIELTDLVGDLHMHTTASDGKASLREMVVAAKQRGLRLHRDHRSFAAREHGQRVESPAATRTVGGDRSRSTANSMTSPSSKASSATSWKRAAWTCRTMCWLKPIGSSPASTTGSSSRGSRSPSGFSARWRIRMSRSSRIRRGD